MRANLVAVAVAAIGCGRLNFDPAHDTGATGTTDGGVIGETYVKASNTATEDQFGFAIAISADGSTMVVGAAFQSSDATGIDGDQSDNSSRHSGAVYVFARSGATWAQQAYVKASNTDPEDQFGFAVSLSADGNTLVAGAPGESSDAIGIDGDQTDNSEVNAGAAYVFTRAGAAWSQLAYVKASNTRQGNMAGGGGFGWAVALSGDGQTLAIGEYNDASDATGIDGNQADFSAVESGAVFMFTLAGIDVVAAGVHQGVEHRHVRHFRYGGRVVE